MKTFALLLAFSFTIITGFAQTGNKECVSDSTVYAAGESWYYNNEPISFKGKKYVKYGLPRILSPGEVIIAGKYKTTPVLAEAGAEGIPEVIYIPVRKGCEFQPYSVAPDPCNIKLKISSVAKNSTSGKTIVFTANTTTPYKKLSYTWYITITKENGDEIEDPDSYIVGKPYSKNLVVSTKGLPKNAVVSVNVTVGKEEADCESVYAELETKVQ